tara:strand:- start:40 stop:516 length:477 start_codon:yes stop_codon:yes gene_type:complete
MIRQQMALWEDPKQIILEKNKVDLCTLKNLKTRVNGFDLLPKDTYFIYKTGGINPFKPELGPIFPFVQNSKGKILNLCNNAKSAPYPHFNINIENKLSLKCFVHKIVALAFLKNSDYDKYYIVDHVDDDIYNYLPENLEWCTVGQNNQRRYDRLNKDD